MDYGPEKGKMCAEMKAKQRRHPSSTQAVSAYHRESTGSNTESLFQERAYQQELPREIDCRMQNKYTLPEAEHFELLQGDEEDEDDAAGLPLSDSLEVTSKLHTKRNPTLQNTEYLDTKTDVREGSWLLPDDSYSDLRYDPNWKTNLRAASLKSPPNSVEAYYHIPEEKAAQTTYNARLKGGHRYIADTTPPVTPIVGMSDQPFHLHLEDSPTSSLASHLDLKHACHRSPEPHQSQGSANKDDVNSNSENCERSCDSERLNTREDGHPAEFKNNYQQWRNTRSNNQQQSQVEDFVELNKITLGCIRSKPGCYGMVHAYKQMPDANEVHETPKKPVSVKNQQDSSDPEQRWLQRTRQLQVPWNGNGKKAQRKEHPNPSQQRPPAAVVKSGQRPCMSIPSAAVTQPGTKKSSSQPLPTTIQLNINFSTSAQLFSFLQQRNGQEALINLASLQGQPRWSLRSLGQPVPTTGSLQKTKPSKISSLPREVLNTQLFNRNLESSSEQWQRASPLQLPLSCEEEKQTWNLLRSPTPSSSQGPDPYTVLPAIGKSLTGEEPSQRRNPTLPFHHSNSDSYLVQMEKKQLKERLDFEAYKMKTDKNLQGQYPGYATVEKTKMIRQKLYSEVIREQNKKLSKIPVLRPKDQEGSENKVPRIKALEYAKTIAKPPVKSQPKQKQTPQNENSSEHQGSDECLLTKLGLLRKRHEEEKQVVAQFRKQHAV